MLVLCLVPPDTEDDHLSVVGDSYLASGPAVSRLIFCGPPDMDYPTDSKVIVKRSYAKRWPGYYKALTKFLDDVTAEYPLDPIFTFVSPNGDPPFSRHGWEYDVFRITEILLTREYAIADGRPEGPFVVDRSYFHPIWCDDYRDLRARLLRSRRKQHRFEIKF